MTNSTVIKKAFSKVKEDINDINFKIDGFKKSNNLEIDRILSLEKKFDMLTELLSEKINVEINSLKLELMQEIQDSRFEK